MRIDYLINKLSEQYQDIEYNGRFYGGIRDCVTRWGIIEKHLPKTGIVMDIGSAQGYFTSKIANRQRMVISIDNDGKNTDLQRLLFSERENIYVGNEVVTPGLLREYRKSVNMIDCVLALSVLHHFPNPEMVIDEISRISLMMIVELAAPDEVNACGGINKGLASKEVIGKYFQYSELIGKAESHVDEGKLRLIYKFWNPGLRRGKLASYIGNMELAKNHHELVWNGRSWILNGMKVEPSVNLWNLLHLNIVSPDGRWFLKQAMSAYNQARLENGKLYDIRPWNLIVEPSGIRAIDYTLTNDDVLSVVKEKLKDWLYLETVFTNMKPVGR
jgi:SAM-dependent methyltransferase